VGVDVPASFFPLAREDQGAKMDEVRLIAAQPLPCDTPMAELLNNLKSLNPAAN